MREPLSPVVHPDPSLSYGGGDGLYQALVVGFWDGAILVSGTVGGICEQEGLFFPESNRLMKGEQPFSGSETERSALEVFQGW